MKGLFLSIIAALMVFTATATPMPPPGLTEQVKQEVAKIEPATDVAIVFVVNRNDNPAPDYGRPNCYVDDLPANGNFGEILTTEQAAKDGYQSIIKRQCLFWRSDANGQHLFS